MYEDEVLYQDGSILISKTLARFGEVSYPVNGIGSVYVASPKRAGMIVGTVIFLALAFLFNSLPVVSILALVFAALFIFRLVMMQNRLMLRTASGDQQAYESRNKSKLSEIKSAIERAVVLRG